MGRTINMQRRFLNHDHLSDNVKRIEYIICKTEADMIWKEIYYINLFFNDKSTNTQDVYLGGVTNLLLNDSWMLYKKYDKKINNKIKERLTIQQLEKFFNGYNLRKLINICDHDKINEIGMDKYSLSKKWFYDSSQIEIKHLRNNIYNYFKNITKSESKNIMWTTYDDTKMMIQGKGYTKGFVSLDSIMDDIFVDRTRLAFVTNSFLPVNKHDVTVNEDNFALSEMLQFIWRSAIRKGEEIYIYIPSIRMRELLEKWIVENSNNL